MHTETSNKRPNISKRAFWDIDYEAIDWNSNSQYLIIRVIERGKLQDIINLLKYYGKEKVKNELLTASKLPQRTYNFALTYFGLKKEDFKCTISRL